MILVTEISVICLRYCTVHRTGVPLASRHQTCLPKFRVWKFGEEGETGFPDAVWRSCSIVSRGRNEWCCEYEVVWTTPTLDVDSRDVEYDYWFLSPKIFGEDEAGLTEVLPAFVWNEVNPRSAGKVCRSHWFISVCRCPWYISHTVVYGG